MVRFLGRKSFPEFEPEGSADWRWDGVADLPMLLQDGAEKLERVVESLGSGTFSNRDDPVLKRNETNMKNLASSYLRRNSILNFN